MPIPSSEQSATALLEPSGLLGMTLEEALKRDFSANPLSEDERARAMDALAVSLIALGCPLDRLEEIKEKAISEVHRPKRLKYLEAIEQLEAERRQR